MKTICSLNYYTSIIDLSFFLTGGGLFVTTLAQLKCKTVADCGEILCAPEKIVKCQNSKCVCVKRIKVRSLLIENTAN